MTDSSTLRKTSNFTYRHLSQLPNHPTDNPLRIIAHIDLDAFYAQCEMKRIGSGVDEPLAVQQWQSLIAINYPARKAGLSRHITSTEALKLCPNLILVHVATWRAGETHWSYRQNPSIVTNKACLDPYRLESKKILSIFRSECPRVEKASIDESFLDLSAMVHERLLQRYPELTGSHDQTENLPLPPQDKIDWSESNLVELTEGIEVAETQLDWDDVVMSIAAEIVGAIRGKVNADLGYTCSAGIGPNKMLAKLGSGHKKPNAQTVVRSAAVQPFLNTFNYTKIRNLGGKLGDKIKERFSTESLVDLLAVPLPQLQTVLDDDTATWVYNIIRGIDKSDVNPRTQIKSMLSAKSFRPYVHTLADAEKWLRILVADISSRLEEEGVMEGKRRPKTMTLSYRTKDDGAKAKSAPIPMGSTVSVERLMGIALHLLRGVENGGRAWPCAGLSLAVSGFEEREAGNMGIAGFLVRRDQTKATNQGSSIKRAGSVKDNEQKKRKIDNEIEEVLQAAQEDDLEDSELGLLEDIEDRLPDELEEKNDITINSSAAVLKNDRSGSMKQIFPKSPPQPHEPPQKEAKEEKTVESTFTCSSCHFTFPVEQQSEHQDWHFAKSLAAESRAAARERIASSAVLPPAPSAAGKKSTSSKKPTAAGAKRKKGVSEARLEKGQKKLGFGS